MNDMEETNENQPVDDTSSPSSTHLSGCWASVPVTPPVKMPLDPLFDTGNECEISRTLLEIFFYFFCGATAILAVYVTFRGFQNCDPYRFNPFRWYLPMITGMCCGCVTALVLHFLVKSNPGGALRTSFWPCPMLTFAVYLMVLSGLSFWCLGFGLALLALFYAQLFYSSWVNSRLAYAMTIVSVTTAAQPDLTTSMTLIALVTAAMYSALLGLAIVGSAAMGTKWDPLAIFGFTLSLLWILHTTKYTVQTMIARVKYKSFAEDEGIPTWWAIRDTVKYLVGSVALGSAMVPVFTLLRGAAWTLHSVFGGSDIFNRVVTMLQTKGNRYGFVYAGVYNRGFVVASGQAWQVLGQPEVKELVESDLTGSFGFFSGMTGGALSALVAGCWLRAIHEDRILPGVCFALLTGYMMCRIGTAWAQASVSAYYIAYAENPGTESTRFEAIRARLREMSACRREPELSNRRT